MIPLIFDILEKAKHLGQEADQWLPLVVHLERELTPVVVTIVYTFVKLELYILN